MALKAQQKLVNENQRRNETAASLQVQVAQRLEKQRLQQLVQEKQRAECRLAQESRERERLAEIEQAEL